MKIIIVDEKQLPTVQENSNESVIALGFFDGVHKGHQKVILSAKNTAITMNLPLAVMSFYPHPKTVFSNEEMDYLMPLERKAKELEKLGVDIFYIVEFSKSFASLPPKKFIEEYLIKLHVKHAVAGFDYTYGFKGLGTISTIAEHSQHQISVEKIEEFSLFGSKVSSTLLRELLRQGQVEKIRELLGRAYEVNYHTYFGLASNYTLPAPGYYFVTILYNSRAISRIIQISKTDVIKLYTENISTNCTIIFHEKIEELTQLSS